MKKNKIAFITFGCKVNQYETSCIVDSFVNSDFKVVEFNDKADVYIINTCTVTNRTDQKSRTAIRKALLQKENDPNVKVIVTGCYSQRNVDQIKALGDVDLIVDNNSKSTITDLLKQNSNEFHDMNKQHEFDEISTSRMLDKTRAFIKVQDGCDYYCAYCAIPFARGTSRSRKKEKVLEQIEALTQQGYYEFVLGGINLGLYGQEENDGYHLSDLLRDIEKIEKVKLIRLSSIEPNLFTDDLLKYFKISKKICKHFHIPLQAGSDELLKKMGRRYTTEKFANTLNNIKEIFPDAAIGIDVIAGLPGETETLFAKTHEFLSALDFTYLHVFSYSKREGTKAAKMNGHVNGKIIKQRSNDLIKISGNKTAEYIDKILKNNVKLSAVIEQKTGGYWTALSDHYVRIYVKDDGDLEKKYLHFKPVRKKFDGIEVEIIN